jgi:protein SCO1/2
MKKAFLLGLFSLMIVMVTACGESKHKLRTEVVPFEYTNQEGTPFSSTDLDNKIWIADFMFTYCTTVCPSMTANMAELQNRIKDAGLDVELVSFSVDPERDDPAALKSYLEKFKADFTNWHGVTGYSFEDIKTFALQSFRTVVAKDTASDQVIHGTTFFLVDQSGTVVAKYDGMTDVPYDKVIKDIKSLQQ